MAINKVAVQYLSQFDSIGTVQIGNQTFRVMPNEVMTRIVAQLIGRTGGQAPDITVITELSDIMGVATDGSAAQYLPELIIGDMNSIREFIREAVAQEVSMQQQVKPDSAAAMEMTIGIDV